MMDKFTKADLKDGTVVEQNNKDRYLVVGDRVLSHIGFNPLTQYEDDLINSLDEEYGIEKVFKVKNKCVNSLEEIFYDKNLELIWQRKEVKRMTAEEMKRKLEKLTGEMIEVEPTREEMIGKLELYCAGAICTKCVLSEMSAGCDCCKFDSEKLKRCYKKVMGDENRAY